MTATFNRAFIMFSLVQFVLGLSALIVLLLWLDAQRREQLEIERYRIS